MKAVNKVQQKKLSKVDQRMLRLLVPKNNDDNLNSPIKKYTFMKTPINLKIGRK